MTNPQNCEDCGTFGPVVVLGSGRFTFKVCADCASDIAAALSGAAEHFNGRS